jgi:hypothetical protein
MVAGVVLVLLLSIHGCGDDGMPATDASVDAADSSADASEVVVTPPEAPALPVMTPCPDGWREEDSGEGFVYCVPWPGAGPEDCAAREAHFPGTAGCEPLGTSCPADGLPRDLPAGRTARFVRAGEVGGDGSRGTPFGTIAEAIAVAASGDVVAVGVGTYDEEVTLPEGVALIGACVSGTTLTASAARAGSGVVNAVGADVEVANLTIADSPRVGLWVVGDGVSAVARDIAIADVAIAGVTIELGASFDAERISVRDVVPAPLAPLGRGLNVETNSTANVRFADIRGAVEFGVLAYGGARLTLSDALVAGTRSFPDRNGGPGLVALSGGIITANRIALDDNQQVGLLVDEGSEVTAEDVMITDTQAWGELGAGRAINVEEGSTFTCTRCTAQRCREIAIGFGESVATMTDVFVSETLPGAGGALGRGVTIQLGSEAALTRIAITDALEIGLTVSESQATVADLVVRRVASQESDDLYGRGIGIQMGASADFSRVEISDVREAGIVVTDDGSSMRAADLIIRDVASRPSGFLGRGVITQLDASFELIRGRVENVREVGVMGAFGASLALEDVTINGVLPQECSADACASYPGGHGIGSYDDTLVTATNFVVDDASLCGLHVTDGSRIVGTAGLVTHATIGACLQSDLQELDELSRGVQYVNNDSNFESTSLPVPEAIAATE